MGREVPLPVDARYGVQSSESVPGVQDVHAELAALMAVLKPNNRSSAQSASKRDDKIEAPG